MEKKTKLTISGGAKKSIKNIEIARTQGKNSRVIEKKTSKFVNKGSPFKSSSFKSKSNTTFNRNTTQKNFQNNLQTNDFERRKLAEQRATKRLKGESENRDKKNVKISSKKEKLN